MKKYNELRVQHKHEKKVKATEIFAVNCRNLPLMPDQPVTGSTLNRKFRGIIRAGWQTKGRQAADKGQNHSMLRQDTTPHSSAGLQTVFALCRTFPEERGVFPEAFPNNSRRNGVFSRTSPEDFPKKGAGFLQKMQEPDRFIPEEGQNIPRSCLPLVCHLIRRIPEEMPYNSRKMMSPDQLRYYDLRNEPFYFVERKEKKGIFEGWKMYLKNFPTAASLSVELRGSFATLQTVSASTGY
jgi:hypothetical protein